MNKFFKIIWVLLKKRQRIKTLGSIISHFQLHFQSMTQDSGMWDPVVSEAFWKQHPRCQVRSCSLLSGFKVQAKPLVAVGWVIASWAGTGCIGRAPSPWGKQLSLTACPMLDISSTHWLIKYLGLSPLRLQGALYLLPDDGSEPVAS